MKKYLSILFLIAFIIPSIAFASWWNPFTWFQKNTKPIEQSTAQVPQDNVQTNGRYPKFKTHFQLRLAV